MAVEARALGRDLDPRDRPPFRRRQGRGRVRRQGHRRRRRGFSSPDPPRRTEPSNSGRPVADAPPPGADHSRGLAHPGNPSMTDAPGLEAYARNYLDEAKAALDEPTILAAVHRIVPILLKARDEGRAVFFFGNGGSASTASHFVVDIAKSAIRGKGRSIRCIGLSDNIPSMTAWANDADYSRIFAEPLKNLAVSGDVVVAISGSGGGKLKEMVDVALVVPSNSMQHTEDVHVAVLHLLTAYLRDEGPVSER